MSFESQSASRVEVAEGSQAQRVGEKFMLEVAESRSRPESDPLKSLTDIELGERINKLSRTPMVNVWLKALGPEQGFSVESLDLLYQHRLDGDRLLPPGSKGGRPIGAEDLLAKNDTYGLFDQKKAETNLEQYKKAYEELIRRVDDPASVKDGQSLAPDQLLTVLTKVQKSIREGKDYFKEPVDGEYETLSPDNRLRYHGFMANGLSQYSERISVRMDYAMRMETLGQRVDAGLAYSQALELLNSWPYQLVNSQRELLERDKPIYAQVDNLGMKVDGVEADQLLSEITSTLNGDPNHGSGILDDGKGLNGKSAFIDPLEKGKGSMLALYGLDDLPSALAKRAAWFYLAPEFELKMSAGKPIYQYVSEKSGTPRYVEGIDRAGLLKDYGAELSEKFKKQGVDVEDEAVKAEIEKLARQNLQAKGEWTFGNSDAFKPGMAMDPMVHALRDHDNLSIADARKKVNELTAEAVRYAAGAKDVSNSPDFKRLVTDPEFSAILNGALSNLEPSLANSMKKEAAENGWSYLSDGAAALTGVAALAVLTRGRALRPVAGQSLLTTTARATTLTAGSFGAAYAGRSATMYAFTGEVEPWRDSAVHAGGSLLAGLIGTRAMAQPAVKNSLNILPENSVSLNPFKSYGFQVSPTEFPAWLNREVGTVGNLKNVFENSPSLAGRFTRYFPDDAAALAQPIDSALGREIVEKAGLSNYQSGIARELNRFDAQMAAAAKEPVGLGKRVVEGVKNFVPGVVNRARNTGDYLYNSVKLHKPGVESTRAQVMGMHNGQALYGTLGMGLAYQSTAGAYDLTQRIDKSTGEYYSFPGALADSLIPGMGADSSGLTGDLLIGALSVAGTTMAIRTGRLPRDILIAPKNPGSVLSYGNAFRKTIGGLSDNIVTRSVGRLKAAASSDTVAGATSRSLTSSGLYIAGPAAITSAAAAVTNGIDRHEFKTYIQSGKSSLEKLRTAYEPISNDPKTGR
ncbi:hypothetical protein GC174_00445 [bacterium]|nr:hypothetical protein [bacterium]